MTPRVGVPGAVGYAEGAPPCIAVFDLGGVVVRICRSWQEGCRAAGVPYRPHAEPLLRTAEFAALLDAHQRGQLPCEEFHARAARLMDGAYTPAELQAVHDAWVVGDYPGMVDAIDRIHCTGIDTGCLSNTNAGHWRQLDRSASLARIRHRHASHLLGMAKPDAAIYRRFEQVTGYAAHQIMFFDDLAPNVDAARACGWRAVQVDPAGDTAAQVLAALTQAGIRV